MAIKIYKALRNWIIHTLVIWFIAQCGSFINYLEYSRIILNRQPHTFNLHWPDLFVLSVFLLSAEVNYAFVFKRWRWYVFITSSALSSIVSFGVLIIVLKKSPLDLYDAIKPVALMISYGFVYAWLRDYFYQRLRRKEIELQQSKNELDTLKAQLNPHFLFNSLNYLYGTALNEHAPDTADGIDKLSAMMRYSITGIHENFVTLENELAFIKNYLDLQLARIPQKYAIDIKVKLEIQPPALQIAPLLILPFIENAFQYGISMDEPCYVNIAIRLEQNVLKLIADNSIVNHTAQTKGNNTGIKNTIKRLDLLYPQKYELQQIATQTQYQVKLNIQLNP